MNISKRQADVFKIMTDIILKCIVTFVSLGVFVFILYEFFNTECSWESKVPLGIVEAILAGTLYKMFDHFFPKANN
jgi:hypothetical protein